MNISSIAADLSKSPDLPALRQLARALWHNGSIRGAALIVGASFSKNAIFQAPDTPEPPNWSELLSELIGQLYPTDKSSAPTDALRIAEEYRTYFGQAAIDLHARAQRIIKLHGTLGDKDPLIFAEDYHTYPVRHAAFVNLARQIFIENDLCLPDFSGNDPNFLEWTGWVRDQPGWSVCPRCQSGAQYRACRFYLCAYADSHSTCLVAHIAARSELL